MPEAGVKLRPIAEDDLPDYVRWFDDAEVTEFTAMEVGDITMEREREWFARISDPASRDRYWAIEVDGRHVGNCALTLDASGQIADFGIVIGEKAYWDKGHGSAAVREALRIGFEEMGLHRVCLNVFAGNHRAMRCYEKCGFRREGVQRKSFLKRGEWIDVVLMAVLKEEWECPSSA
jgi:RimJ/RimL family protein N-acetyltransferase